MDNKPPYTITDKAADYLAKIVESITRLEYGTDFKRNIYLHRENRLMTIHSSLAIEGNPLTLSEVRAVIDGKLVAGKQVHIKEVKNAYEAYDKIMSFDPYSIKDFFHAHKLMADGLVEQPGSFRDGDAGVFDGDIAIHLGARPQYVYGLVSDLFAWARESDLHPVLKSAIVHYEIEVIHPFSDGNGRMGRLWQTLILAKWNEVFQWIPMETVINDNRPDYYKAIMDANNETNSAKFIEFALKAVLESIEHQDKHQDKHQDSLSEIQIRIIEALEQGDLSRNEIFGNIGLKNDTRVYRRHIEPLLDLGLIEMTIPETPTSRNQRYSLTKKGR